MTLEEILKELEMLINNAKTIPFSPHKIIVDADRATDLIKEAQLKYPPEIRRAKLIDQECETILQEARNQAESIVQDAENRAKILTSEQAVLKEANRHADEITVKAENRANDVRRAVKKYVNNVLAETEACLQKNLEALESTKEQIEKHN